MRNTFFNSNEVMAGGYLPRPVSDHFSLAALYEGSSRAQMITMLVKDYLVNKSIDEMITALAQKIFDTWKSKGVARRDFNSFMAYLERDVRPKLIKRRISHAHIAQILKRVGDMHAENQRIVRRQA